MDEIGCTCIVDMGEHLKQLQNDLNHYFKSAMGNASILGVFLVILGL